MRVQKQRKKNTKEIRRLIGIISLLFSCFIIVLLILTFTNQEEVYTIESRVSQIKKEKKTEKKEDLYNTIGWLRVQGTKIDTPIIGYQTTENISINKDDFLWNEIENEKLYNKVNIMGHNILNLSSNPMVGEEDLLRFEELMSFVYTDFAKENKYIQYTIDGKDYLYKIFAIHFDSQWMLDLYHEGNYTKKEMKNFITKVKKNSIYDFDVDVNENDKVISLVTCTRFFGDDRDKGEFVVTGRMLREGEQVTNYEVKENKNYKAVKNQMKGEDSDEKNQTEV